MAKYSEQQIKAYKFLLTQNDIKKVSSTYGACYETVRRALRGLTHNDTSNERLLACEALNGLARARAVEFSNDLPNTKTTSN